MRPTATEWRSLAALAVLFLIQTTALTFGADLTTAGRATIFIATFPFFTALSAHLLIPDDRLTPSKTAGIVIAFTGVIVTVGVGEVAGIAGRSLAGDLITLASGALLGLRTVITKRMVRRTEPVRLLFWMMMLSLPGSVGLSLLFETGPGVAPIRLTAAGIGGMLYAGVVIAGFCFIVSTAVLRRYAASKVTVLFFAEPPFGVLLSFLILGEQINVSLGVGAALVGLGIYFVNRASGHGHNRGSGSDKT